MFQIIRRAGGLSRTQLSRSLPAFSTSPSLNQDINKDPTTRKEAPILDNETVLEPEHTKYRRNLETSITVAARPDLTPINGIPEEQLKERRVRIYQPSKNAMQSGTNNIHHWQMEFNNCQRWENPLMGWTSTGDPLSNMKIHFSSPDEAIEHCEKNGWSWFLDVPKIEKEMKPKNYGLNFSWNRRTRVSTK